MNAKLSNITCKMLNILAEGLRKLIKLEFLHLDLQDNSITDDLASFSNIFRELKSLSSLTLVLSNNKISSLGLIEMS